jgi:hypothetical protein
MHSLREILRRVRRLRSLADHWNRCPSLLGIRALRVESKCQRHREAKNVMGAVMEVMPRIVNAEYFEEEIRSAR